VSPRGCPGAADLDPDDDQPWWIESTALGTIVVRWPTHREMVVFPFSNLSVSTWAMLEERPTQLANWAALMAACKVYDAASSKAADGTFVSPRGCPEAAEVDGADGRAWWIESTAPGTIVVRWPTHREMVVTWTLTWKGAWKLQAIDFAS